MRELQAASSHCLLHNSTLHLPPSLPHSIHTTQHYSPQTHHHGPQGGRPAGRARHAGQRRATRPNHFGEIEKMLAAKPASTSRPTTPRMSSAATSATGKAVHTPATSSARTSEEDRREEERRNQQVEKGAEISAPVEQLQQKSSSAGSGAGAGAGAGAGGGWWGSMFSAATAAVKQAENLAKEIRGNEEAIKWAEQVRGYGANLSSLSITPLPIQSRAALLTVASRHRSSLQSFTDIHKSHLAYRSTHISA